MISTSLYDEITIFLSCYKKSPDEDFQTKELVFKEVFIYKSKLKQYHDCFALINNFKTGSIIPKFEEQYEGMLQDFSELSEEHLRSQLQNKLNQKIADDIRNNLIVQEVKNSKKPKSPPPKAQFVIGIKTLQEKTISESSETTTEEEDPIELVIAEGQNYIEKHNYQDASTYFWKAYNLATEEGNIIQKLRAMECICLIEEEDIVAQLKSLKKLALGKDFPLKNAFKKGVNTIFKMLPLIKIRHEEYCELVRLQHDSLLPGEHAGIEHGKNHFWKQLINVESKLTDLIEQNSKIQISSRKPIAKSKIENKINKPKMENLDINPYLSLSVKKLFEIFANEGMENLEITPYLPLSVEKLFEIFAKEGMENLEISPYLSLSVEELFEIFANERMENLESNSNLQFALEKQFEDIATEIEVILPNKIKLNPMISDIKINLPENISNIFKFLEQFKGKHYLVGSMVLKLLLNEYNQSSIVAHDVDFISTCNDRTSLIISGFRENSYIKTLYSLFRGFEYPIDLMSLKEEENWLEASLSSRDFTIAAFSCDNEGNIIDSTGQGIEDLIARRLVMIGSPNLRFKEDPVLLLRTIKYMVFGFKPNDVLLEALHAWQPGPVINQLKLNAVARKHLLKPEEAEPFVELMGRFNLINKMFNLPNKTELFSLLGLPKKKQSFVPRMGFFTPQTIQTSSDTSLKLLDNENHDTIAKPI